MFIREGLKGGRTLKEKKCFLFMLCLPMLLIFSSTMGFAAGTHTVVSKSAAGGYQRSTATGGTTTTEGTSSGFRAALKGGTTREFNWVTRNADAPADKSSVGAEDGSSISNKGNTFTTTVLKSTVIIGQEVFGSTFGVYKGFFSFDTSGVPQDATDISMDLVIYGKRPVVNNGGTDFYLEVFRSVYVEPLWNSDWGAVVGPPLEEPASRINVTQLHYTADPNASIETIDPNSCRNVIHIKDALSLLDWGGTTKLALVSSRSFAGQQATGNEYVEIFAPTSPNKGLRPELRISYVGSYHEPKPSLTWLTGDAFFKDGGAVPNQIYEGQTVKVDFRVRYFSTTADGVSGKSPSVHQVLIDRSGDGDYDDAGEQIDLTPDPNDTDYSDGVDYGASVDIVSTESRSNIKYQFRFNTIDGVVAGGAPSTVQLITAIQSDKDSKSSNNLCFISSIALW